MKKTASVSKRQGRIVNVSSDGHQYTYPEGIRFIKLMMNQGKIYPEEILLQRLNFITIGIHL